MTEKTLKDVYNMVSAHILNEGEECNKKRYDKNGHIKDECPFLELYSKSDLPKDFLDALKIAHEFFYEKEIILERISKLFDLSMKINISKENNMKNIGKKVVAEGLEVDKSEPQVKKSIRMQFDSQQNFMPLFVQNPCSCHGWPPPTEITENDVLPMIEGPNLAHSGLSNIFGWLSPENLPFRTPILVKHVGIYGAEEHPVVYMGVCTMEDGLNVLLLSHPTKPSATLRGDEIQKIIGWKALPQ